MCVCRRERCTPQPHCSLDNNSVLTFLLCHLFKNDFFLIYGQHQLLFLLRISVLFISLLTNSILNFMPSYPNRRHTTYELSVTNARDRMQHIRM